MLQVDRRLIFAVAALLMVSSALTSNAAVTTDEHVCNVAADVALGLGDYPTAIELHQRLLQSEGNDAIAHYHLGFTYGMAGHTTEEIDEYRAAIRLGLKSWDPRVPVRAATARTSHATAGAARARSPLQW